MTIREQILSEIAEGFWGQATGDGRWYGLELWHGKAGVKASLITTPGDVPAVAPQNRAYTLLVDHGDWCADQH